MHWIDYLENEGRIAQCKPNDFKFEGEWLPLYTRAGITRHISSVSSLIKTQGDSPLIAIVPPDMLFQLEQEYVICQLLVLGNHLLWGKPAEAAFILPLLRGNEQKHYHHI